MRTDFSVRLTRYDTKYVQIFPRKLYETKHSTHVFPCTNYTVRYIVCTEVSIVPEGSRMKSRVNNTNVQTLNVRTRTVLVYNLYFLLMWNKISLQSVEGLNRTFFFSPSSFSVVLRSNQLSKRIVSVYHTLLLRESFNQSELQSTLFTFRFTFIHFNLSSINFKISIFA